MDSVPTKVLLIECMNCRKKGLWKALPFEDDKPTRYKCQNCQSIMKDNNVSL